MFAETPPTLHAVSELPPPAPPAPAIPVGPTSAPPVARTFATPWRVMLVVTWGAVILAFAAVWKTSEELGIGTWWLGTRSNPSMALVRLVPFVIAAVPTVAVSYNVRWAWWASLGGSLGLMVVALPDFSRSAGLAVVELVIAAAALLVTACSWTGRFPATGPAADVARAGDAQDAGPLPAPSPVDAAAGPPLER